ncbi:MAG: hypothetical protein HGA29_06240, partial [Syntrophaceae bacterium]|nr:hypothetical protein [Syntrophaceae bacterium]
MRFNGSRLFIIISMMLMALLIVSCTSAPQIKSSVPKSKKIEKVTSDKSFWREEV